MRRRNMMCILGLALLLLGGCAKQEARMDYIGEEAAARQALEASGLTEAGVEALDADLKVRNGLDYYQVTFTAGGQEYQYDVDALTGAIIESQSPGDAEESGQPVNTGEPAQTAPESQEPVQTTPGVEQPAPTPDPGTEAKLLTADEAKAKALAHAGLTGGQVTVTKCRLEWDDGRQVYDVEFRSETMEYEYEIDAADGEVIGYSREEKGSAGTSGGSMISADRAKELALAQVPGAALGDIREFEVDYDDGRVEYEGKIVYNGMKYEFEIDAYSGAFRSWEAEPAGH